MKAKDVSLWIYVQQTLNNYAAHFSLELRDIRPLKKKHRGLFVASCSRRGRIRMDLRNRFGKRFDAYHLIDTMSHELAHLKHQNHSRAWFDLHFQIQDLMRVSGVYEDLRRLLKKRH